MRIISINEVEAVSGGLDIVDVTIPSTSTGSTDVSGGGWVGPTPSLSAPVTGETYSGGSWGNTGKWG